MGNVKVGSRMTSDERSDLRRFVCATNGRSTAALLLRVDAELALYPDGDWEDTRGQRMRVTRRLTRMYEVGLRWKRRYG